MAKTKEELNSLKNEYETLTNKLKELNDEELGFVTGGTHGTYGEEPSCFTDYSCSATCVEFKLYCHWYDRCNNPKKEKYGDDF